MPRIIPCRCTSVSTATIGQLALPQTSQSINHRRTRRGWKQDNPQHFWSSSPPPERGTGRVSSITLEKNIGFLEIPWWIHGLSWHQPVSVNFCLYVLTQSVPALAILETNWHVKPVKHVYIHFVHYNIYSIHNTTLTTLCNFNTLALYYLLQDLTTSVPGNMV